MELLIIILVVGVAAFQLGKHWARLHFVQNLSENPDKFIKMLEHIKEINAMVEDDNMPEDAIPMDVEKVGDNFYGYNQLTGEFLAQGATIQQLIELASTRFPGKKFWHTTDKQSSQNA